MPGKVNTPSIELNQLRGMATGLQANPPAGQATILVDGVVVAISALVSEFNGYAAVWQDAVDTQKVAEKAVKKRTTMEPQVMARHHAVALALRGALGKSNPDLGKYALAPEKARTKLTTAQQIEKAKKAKATREARHTMGSKQKKAVKGVVTPPKA